MTRRRLGHHALKVGLALLVSAALAILSGATWLAHTPVRPIPAFCQVRDTFRSSDAKLLDRNGELLHELRVDDRGRRLEWVPLARTSPALVRAVLRSEDHRFYQHRGADWLALARAAAGALGHRSRGGASTITMQVTALAEGPAGRRGRRSLPQKTAQIRQALALERTWSKAEILEAYLNLAAFRGELRGIHAASRGFFSKDPSGLNAEESSILAALLRSPNAAPTRVASRAYALSNTLGNSVSADRFEALAREVFLRPYAIVPPVSLAPHVARLLLGRAPESRRSTLDAKLQRVAANALTQQVLSLRDRHVGDGAVLVVANRTGEVLSYVGNVGAASTSFWVDGVTAARQAGSTLKPFLYSLVLEKRLLTAASLLDDSPLDVPTARGAFAPHNYDRQFRGLVPLRTALASSLNVPAVRTLLLLPPDALAERLRNAGFSRVRTGEEHGAALALGGTDVTLWELVNAYRTLATGGTWSPLTLVPNISPPKARRVLSREASFLVSDILSDRGAREETFGLESVLSTPFWSAVKTGTSKDMRDNWCVGFSRDYTVGVWVGNFSGEPMWDVSGMSGAAPVWSELMAYLHRSGTGKPPTPPSTLISRRITYPGGIGVERNEWFLPGTEPVGGSVALKTSPGPTLRFPSPGLTIALDPDIPEERQRVFFEAKHAGSRHRYVLDGADAGAPNQPIPWRPTPGPHVLSLVDARGTTVDQVRFIVTPAR